MKRSISFLLSVIIILSALCLPVGAKSFVDVAETDWFYPAVNQCVALGYMSGTASNTFSPHEPITRAMIIQVLYNLSGESAKYTGYFSDVKKGAWYADAVSWAKEKGIASGTSANKFSPNSVLTREQLAGFYFRYTQKYGITLAKRTPVDYLDEKQISDWAVYAVSIMNNAGIITTRPAECFLPKGTVSRAELAGSLLRLMGDYENGVYDSSSHVQLIYNDISSATLEAGRKLTLKTTVWPSDAVDKKVTYTSSDPKIATVDANGNITAVAKGKAYITAVSRDDGHRSTCTVTVSPKPAAISSVKAEILNYISDYDVEIKPIGRVIDLSKPMVALTYDDGPRPKSTNRILDCLEKYNAVATFFELGYLAKAYPDCIRREAKLGCEVANHSWDHPNLATLSAGSVLNQINSTNDTIYNICGVKPTVMRPPYGSYNSTVSNNAGMPLIIWSIDTLDWRYRDASYVTSVIKNQVTDGSIILMHSIYDSTAAATEAIVPWLISQGYQLVTVSELAEARGIDMQNGASYHSFYKKK